MRNIPKGGRIMPLYKYDIFISYSHKDNEWVRNQLLPKLESHGFSILIDFRDFKTGTFSVEEMQRGVIECRRILLVLSENYFESEWAKFENVMAQSADPGSSQRKIIPVLKDSCDIPLRLKVLHYRDLRDDDITEWELLVRDLI